MGTVTFLCSSGVSIAQLGGPSFSGLIASDGTFTASTPTEDGLGVTISGNSPNGSQSTWNGTYTITASDAEVPGCTYSSTANFTAAPIAAFTGTFTGASQSFTGPGGANLGTAITLQVTQEPPTLVTLSSGISVYEVPLSATVAFTGSNCFTTGTTAGVVGAGNVHGDSFDIFPTMNDGSSLALSGSLNDLGVQSVTVIASGMGGNCNGVIANATLTRQ